MEKADSTAIWQVEQNPTNLEIFDQIWVKNAKMHPAKAECISKLSCLLVGSLIPTLFEH